MESKIETLAEEVLERPNVVGLLCVDSDGLPIIANGVANKGHASTLVKVAELAAKINPSGKESMAISLDIENCRINARSNGGIVTAIYKSY